MGIESEYFLHVTCGAAGPASALMARIALHVGHDAKAYPMDLSEIKRVTDLSLESDGTPSRLHVRSRRVLNELMVAELARQFLMTEVSWRDDQVAAFRALAGPEASTKVHVLRVVAAQAAGD